MKRSLDWQLGMMTAEYVIATELPTLSTDMLKTRNVIEVSSDLAAEWKQMEDAYNSLGYGNEGAEELFYANLKWYKRNIEDRYLEDELKILVPKISPENLEEFASGFETALWNCDLSHYSYSGFEQTDEIAWCSYIILKRSK